MHGAGDARMTAVEDDDLVLSLRLVGEGEHVVQCEAVVARLRVAGEEVATRFIDVPVTCKVEQCGLSISLEQGPHSVPQFCTLQK